MRVKQMEFCEPGPRCEKDVLASCRAIVTAWHFIGVLYGLFSRLCISE